MNRTWLWTIAALVVVFGMIFGGKSLASHRAAVAASHRSYPPVTVAAATAHMATWKPDASAVGSLEAVKGTEITAQIAGNVMALAFKSGARVRQGELLVRLDDSTQRAQLDADTAKLALAAATLARTQKLYAAHAASQLDLQTAQANAGTARAAVEGDRATLAKLNIVAPFTGVLGIRKVSVGQYVSPGTAIVGLQSYDPLLLDFSLPQTSLATLAPGQAVAFSVDTWPGRTFHGRVTALGSRVDPGTRNVDVQATLANPQGRLRPGMFGKVGLELGAPVTGVAVPATALVYSTLGDSVYVIKTGPHGGAIAHQQSVRVSAQRGDAALLADGVQVGERVVTAGQNKLHDGAPVAVDNSAEP